MLPSGLVILVVASTCSSLDTTPRHCYHGSLDTSPRPGYQATPPGYHGSRSLDTVTSKLQRQHRVIRRGVLRRQSAVTCSDEMILVANRNQDTVTNNNQSALTSQSNDVTSSSQTNVPNSNQTAIINSNQDSLTIHSTPVTNSNQDALTEDNIVTNSNQDVTKCNRADETNSNQDYASNKNRDDVTNSNQHEINSHSLVANSNQGSIRTGSKKKATGSIEMQEVNSPDADCIDIILTDSTSSSEGKRGPGHCYFWQHDG